MKILNKEVLTQFQNVKVTKIEVLAPLIASKAKPGQFIVLMVVEKGERIPLTVVDKDLEKGSITLIVQEVGLTTKLLGKLKKGDDLYALVGPLGNATEIKQYGKVILVGGGVGIAEIYPVAKALKDAGNHVVVILGARTKKLLILDEELKKIADKVYITTDDGSYGQKGFTTDILKNLLKDSKFDLVYAVGPIPMMSKVSGVTKEESIKTIVSLNALMVDATGMCGGCRVSVGNETKFTCVDGPEFDAHLVNWNELGKRVNVYNDKEKHICRLYKL